jgi:hypothetical protein
MNKKPTVKVMFNQWGNYVCFVGTSRVLDTAEQWRAQDWLNEQVAKGCKVSDKSYLKEQP